MRRAVITGMASVSPLGLNLEENLASLRAAKTGIGPISHYDTSNSEVKLACQVNDFDPLNYMDKKAAKRMDRVTQFAIAAALDAYKDAGFEDKIENSSNFATIVATGIGGIKTIEDSVKLGMKRGFDRVSALFIPMAISNMVSAEISIRLGLHGASQTPVTACAASANAIGEGFRLIKDGYQDICLCGGAEAAITPLAVGGFTSMKALTKSEDVKRASIPFDLERSGFVMGEGASILIIEELEHARKRGAKIYAEILGYGQSSDALHITRPHPEGKYAARAMKEAIREAGIKIEDIDYINAHGTSTSLNDQAESLAIESLFKEHTKNVLVSSTKSMTGHMLGAAGATEALISALSLKYSEIYPIANYEKKDPDINLNLVKNKMQKKDIKFALSNSFGFGGHNVSLLFKKWEEK